MSRIFIHGLGAVSPAGWGVEALQMAISANAPLPAAPLSRPDLARNMKVRPVPSPATRPAFLAHPRLRRASAIAQHAVAAALEALATDAPLIQAGTLRVGIIICTMTGCVAYSRRFYEEVLREPATASPLLFPETVFNAPASHLASLLNSPEMNYTLVGDDGSFLNGLALAAGWLEQQRVDGCVVVGTEELDWIAADAARLFHRGTMLSGGAGALYLKREMPGSAELDFISDAFLFTARQSRAQAAQRMRGQFALATETELLCLSTQGICATDAAELAAWQDWSAHSIAPKTVLGEAFTASAAWQCVAACAALRAKQFSAVNVSVVGVNEQAIGARFLAVP